MGLGLEIRLPKTELCPITEERVRKAYENLDREVLNSWRFFHVKHDVLFTGSPSLCFWAGKRCGEAKAIRPAIEEAVKSVLKATADDCREHGLQPQAFVEEAGLMLKSLVDSVCHDMIRIDKTLRGKGYPDKIHPVPLDDAKERLGTGQLEKYIDEQAKAISFLAASAMKANGQTALDGAKANLQGLDQNRNEQVQVSEKARHEAKADAIQDIERLIRLIEELNREKERYARSREAAPHKDTPWVQVNDSLERDWRENVQPLIGDIQAVLKSRHAVIRAHWSSKWRWDTFRRMLSEGKDNYEKWKASGWPNIHIQELQEVSRALASIEEKPNGPEQPGGTAVSGDGGAGDIPSQLLPEHAGDIDTKPVEWDVFISHASEDKDAFVRSLAEALQKNDILVWYDEFTLTVGDGLRRSIDYGLAHSRYGVVVISPDFLKKEWPQKELDGLAAREADGRKVILPVWHKVDQKTLRQYSPLLADRVATSSAKGVGAVVADLMKAMTGLSK